MLALTLLVAAAAAPVTLSYGDDAKQKVDVYAPAPAAAPALGGAALSPVGAPIVVFFHGGVWQHGDRKDYAALGQALADRGVVAVIASYRLTPSARWPAQAEDAAAVVDLALKEAKRFGADPAQLVVAGHSAGAQMAAMLAYDPRFLAKHHRAPADIHALALLSCVCDLQQPLDESQADGGFRGFVQPTFGADKDALAAASPLRVVRQRKTKQAVPFLIVTSEHDYGAMHAQSLAMDQALRALGESVTLLDVPQVDHFGIVTAAQTVDALAALAHGLLEGLSPSGRREPDGGPTREPPSGRREPK